MIKSHVVVDGSNIATEGRTQPSLSQLDDAVRAFQAEFPEPEVTVVVDASFVRRIDETERAAFEAGVEAGEIVVPPGGAVGRGDAFVLSIAERVDASILSNDSFQEFHGEYEWLFEEDRLVGGKPVPGIGWVFVMRTPVRGPTSRRAQREARNAKEEARKEAQQAEQETPKKRQRKKRSSGSRKAGAKAGDTTGGTAAEKTGEKTAETAGEKTPDTSEPSTEGSGATGAQRTGRGSRRSAKTPEPVNDPMAFIAFVSEHPVGSTVEGTVDRFSSHGAYATVGDTDCYVPLKAMGDPAPRSAKEMLTVGEVRSFVVDAFDSPRRSVDLALPGMETAAPINGVAEEISAPDTNGETTMATKKRPAKRGAAKTKSAAKKSTARKGAAKKKAPAKSRSAAKKSTAKKGAAKKSTAKKGAAKKGAAKKSTARKGAAKKKAPAKSKSTAKKSTAKKGVARKGAAKKSTAKKKAPAKSRSTAKKGTAKKSAAKKR